MSAQYPARIGVTDYLRPNTDWHLPDYMVPLPELFRKAGYTTGMTGKWHLSGYNRDGVGMIMSTLEALDLTDNTIVIFTSDNGGESRVTGNAPLRAGKWGS